MPLEPTTAIVGGQRRRAARVAVHPRDDRPAATGHQEARRGRPHGSITLARKRTLPPAQAGLRRWPVASGTRIALWSVWHRGPRGIASEHRAERCRRVAGAGRDHRLDVLECVLPAQFAILILVALLHPVLLPRISFAIPLLVGEGAERLGEPPLREVPVE